ncbi:MAG: metalloregulator ArsR/SmtB family transcription factor [candidate division WOR-3 bacterium]
MRKFIDLFKILSDETRLRLIVALMQGEFCVCELVDALKVSQYNISRHLGVLRKSGLVEDRKDGVWVYYRLSPKVSPIIYDILKILKKHTANENIIEEDKARLEKRLKMRVEGKCIKGYGEIAK